MEPLDILKRSIQRNQRNSIMIALLCFAIIVMVIFTGITGGETQNSSFRSNIISIIVMTVLLLAGLLSIKTSLPLDINTHPVIHALNHPEDKGIVWIYENTIDRRGSGIFRQIYFCRKNGKTEILTVRATEIPLLMEYFLKKIPYVCIGYNNEIKQKYKENPLSLVE